MSPLKTLRNYRPPKVPFGFGTSRISPFTEGPDFVIPGMYDFSTSLCHGLDVLFARSLY